jgi:hypothetical protein
MQNDEFDGAMRLRAAVLAALDTIDDDTRERYAISVLLALVVDLLLEAHCSDVEVEVVAATFKRIAAELVRDRARDADGLQ